MTNFELRPWKADDLKNLVRYANNFEIAKNLTNAFPHPYSREDGLSFIKKISGKDPLNILAISIDGEAVGSIGIHPMKDIHCRNAEIGYWLGQAYWGKGIMTIAVQQMVEYAFKTWKIDRIFAPVFSTNPASGRVLEKAGFKLEATLKNTIYKNNSYMDELVYGIRHIKTTHN